MKVLSICLLWILNLGVSPDSSILADQYISQYKAIAISEMHRTGIPASIKLAQGLLESDWGRSDLASQGNNHFGIKCGGSWEGKSYYKEDDDRNKSGELIASCFRSYDDPYESYIAHSDFLTRNNKQSRYGFLFELSPTDYRSWARGLQKSGYATDPNYPKKLITIIEKYQLFLYDKESTFIAIDNNDSSPIAKEETRDIKDSSLITKKSSQGNSSVHSDEEIKINGVKAIRLAQDYHLADLAKSYKKHTSSLIRNNYYISSKNQLVPQGSIVYLSRKSSKYHGNQSQHQVLENESIATIAHEYGISESYLRRVNKLKKGDKLAADQQLHLIKPARKRNSKTRRSKSPRNQKQEKAKNEEYLFEKGWAKR